MRRSRGSARSVFLAALLLSSGLGGECRWSFKSGDRDDDDDRRRTEAPPNRLTLAGEALSALPVGGGRALLYSTGGRWAQDGEIRWLDLETGGSWTVLGSLSRPFLLATGEEGFLYRNGCSIEFLPFVPSGAELDAALAERALRREPERFLQVRGRALLWRERGESLELPLACPLVGVAFDPRWPAPLGWDRAGDLSWIDLATGVSVPAVPFRPPEGAL